jgi:pyruvate,water dikinase
VIGPGAGLSAAARGANVLNEIPGRQVTWTTTNAGEAAFPGVPTPLSWTWGWWPTERGIRGAFAGLGPLPRSLAPAPEGLADRALTLQFGHAAVSVDLFRMIGDASPGSSAGDVERSWFGSVRPGYADRPRRLRYPVVAARMPWAAWRVRATMARLRVETDGWWRETTRGEPAGGEPAGPGRLSAAQARALLLESQLRFERIAVPHVMVGIICQGLYDGVRTLCARVDLADLSGVLVPGGAEEGAWLAELWNVAHRGGSLEVFLAAHGYHGPLEGELSARSWREDPGPIERLVRSYRTASTESPAEIFARRAAARAAAQNELLGRLPTPVRPAARALLAAARTYMPLRESGRATFLRCYDVARLASRTIGADLASRGHLDDAEDVFHLTMAEARGEGESFTARVKERRELRAEYERISLPTLWTGSPEPIVRTAGDAGIPGSTGPAGDIAGLGVSAGTADGTVRVVIDPCDTDDFEPGDVLVCRATDPSWAALFYLASAVVIDIGGDMSHGAIVARELGLPAVVNTGDGTTRLCTGDHVRVDGSTGTVTRLPTELITEARSEQP